MRPRYLGIIVLAAAAIAAVTLVVSTAGSAPRAHESHSGKKATRQSLFFAVLSGKKEISPTTGKKGAGDLDGHGTFSGLVDRGQTFCFGITVTGLDTPILAHIHKGRPGASGPVYIPLEHAEKLFVRVRRGIHYGQRPPSSRERRCDFCQMLRIIHRAEAVAHQDEPR